MIHIGHCIKQKLEEEGKTTVWLAQQLGYHRANLYLIYEKPTIDTGVLMRISKLLHHNFFDDYADELRESVMD